LFNGRAANAQVYIDALCDAIYQCINEQIDYDRKGQLALAELGIEDAASGIL
jgi:hypothetical protein